MLTQLIEDNKKLISNVIETENYATVFAACEYLASPHKDMLIYPVHAALKGLIEKYDQGVANFSEEVYQELKAKFAEVDSMYLEHCAQLLKSISVVTGRR